MMHDVLGSYLPFASCVNVSVEDLHLSPLFSLEGFFCAFPLDINVDGADSTQELARSFCSVWL